MQSELELPLNKHLDSFGLSTELGIKPNSDRYDIYTRTINSENWGGRVVNFNISNTSLNKLIIGSNCFINFRCIAHKSDDTDVLTADPIELREGAGNLIIDDAKIRIGGSDVYNDGFSTITRHWYERLSNTNPNRLAGCEADRYITDDASVFGLATNTLVGDGIRKSAILDGQEFTITRPLTEMSFFGPRDSAIPAVLPISIDTKLNSIPGRVFCTDDTITASPKLQIIDAELHVYTVEMDDSWSSQFNEALRAGTLLASSDKWASTTMGNSTGATATTSRSSDATIIETTPDVLGVAFLPQASFVSATPWKGVHPMTTNWLNTDQMDIRNYGTSWRTWRNLGKNAEVGRKGAMAREVKKFSGGDVVGLGSPSIDTATYAQGHLSFFPIASRSISDESVLPPKVVSLTFDNIMVPNAAVEAQGHFFYKLRHQWQLSLDPGQTKIVK